ncbi:MAG TPA: tripartite tricarboxylate transporter substrate-binding protein [Xanthobacteraceae bacterium]
MDRRQAVSGLAAACLAAPFAGTASAQAAVADFYRGKQITLLVGYAPGGGYDITARLVARYIGKYIPGHPDIVVQNMPGAGSMRAANYTYVNAPKDGTTFALIARDTPLLGLLGVDPNVRFDVHKFGWVGSSSSYANDAYVLVLGPKAPAHTIAEARKPDTPPLVLGGTGAGGTDADVPKILRDTIGIRIKQVLGYTATPAIVLAVERGEVDGRTFDYSYVKTSRPQWLKSDSGFGILVQFARRTRHPDLPNVPTARELAIDAKARELIVFAETPLLTMARPYAAPPDVPPERLAALRSAFDAAHHDPDFIAESEKLGIDISPVTADAIVHALDDMAHASPTVLDYMKKLMAGAKGG